MTQDDNDGTPAKSLGPLHQEQVRVTTPLGEEVPLAADSTALFSMLSAPVMDEKSSSLWEDLDAGGTPILAQAPAAGDTLLRERLRCLDDVVARVATLEAHMQALAAIVDSSGASSAFAGNAGGSGHFVSGFAGILQPAQVLPASKESTASLQSQGPSSRGSRLRVDSSGSDQKASVTASLEVDRDGQISHLRQALRSYSKHRLGATVWEMGVYFGLPFMSRGSQVLMSFAFMLNFVVQASFCAIIWSSFLDNDLNMTPEDAVRFREELGHDYNSMDRHGWVSLTARVCGGDESLEIATSQVRAVRIIEEYTKCSPWVFGLPAGPVLCTVVLVVWVLCIISDIRDTFSLQLALHALPRCGRTSLEIAGDHFRFTTMTRRRYALVTLLTLVRLYIDVTLMVLGGIYLGKTSELEDLVLNAAALGFILEVDELIFKTIAPAEVETFIHAVEPLQRPVGPSWHGLGPFSVVSLATTLFSVVFLVSEVTMHTMGLLDDIGLRLCREGPKDFIVRSAPSSEVFIGTTREFNGQNRSRAMEAHIARQIIDTGDIYKGQLGAYWPVEHWAFTSVSDRITSEYVSNRLKGLPCVNSINFVGERSMPWQQLKWMLDGTGNESTCEDFVSYCHEPEMNFLRTVCSKTCRCDDPLSGSLYVGPENGCLPRCHEMYLERKEAVPCQDVPASDFSSDTSAVMRLLRSEFRDPQFFAWVSEEGTQHHEELFGSVDADSMYNAMLTMAEQEGGCRLAAAIANFCMFGGAIFCPRACSCFQLRVGDFDGIAIPQWDSCPVSCRSGGPTE